MIKHNTLFIEDGGPCHTAKATQNWLNQNGLNQNGIKKLPWPSQSSDMNPIEHLWAILDQKFCKKNKEPSSKTEYLRLLHETWQEISKEDIHELISSMPKRVASLKNGNRMSTKYQLFTL